MIMEVINISETRTTGLELNYPSEETTVLGSRPAQTSYEFSSNFQKAGSRKYISVVDTMF